MHRHQTPTQPFVEGRLRRRRRPRAGRLVPSGPHVVGDQERERQGTGPQAGQSERPRRTGRRQRRPRKDPPVGQLRDRLRDQRRALPVPALGQPGQSRAPQCRVGRARQQPRNGRAGLGQEPRPVAQQDHPDLHAREPRQQSALDPHPEPLGQVRQRGRRAPRTAEQQGDVDALEVDREDERPAHRRRIVRHPLDAQSAGTPRPGRGGPTAPPTPRNPSTRRRRSPPAADRCRRPPPARRSARRCRHRYRGSRERPNRPCRADASPGGRPPPRPSPERRPRRCPARGSPAFRPRRSPERTCRKPRRPPPRGRRSCPRPNPDRPRWKSCRRPDRPRPPGRRAGNLRRGRTRRAAARLRCRRPGPERSRPRRSCSGTRADRAPGRRRRRSRPGTPGTWGRTADRTPARPASGLRSRALRAAGGRRRPRGPAAARQNRPGRRPLTGRADDPTLPACPAALGGTP